MQGGQEGRRQENGEEEKVIRISVKDNRAAAHAAARFHFAEMSFISCVAESGAIPRSVPWSTAFPGISISPRRRPHRRDRRTCPFAALPSAGISPSILSTNRLAGEFSPNTSRQPWDRSTSNQQTPGKLP